ADRRAAVAGDAVADDAELGQLLNQFVRKFAPFPVVVDDGEGLAVDEVTGAPPVGAFLGGELVGDSKEVGAARAADRLVHVRTPISRRPCVAMSQPREARTTSESGG